MYDYSVVVSSLYMIFIRLSSFHFFFSPFFLPSPFIFVYRSTIWIWVGAPINSIHIYLICEASFPSLTVRHYFCSVWQMFFEIYISVSIQFSFVYLLPFVLWSWLSFSDFLGLQYFFTPFLTYCLHRFSRPLWWSQDLESSFFWPPKVIFWLSTVASYYTTSTVFTLRKHLLCPSVSMKRELLDFSHSLPLPSSTDSYINVKSSFFLFSLSLNIDLIRVEITHTLVYPNLNPSQFQIFLDERKRHYTLKNHWFDLKEP